MSELICQKHCGGFRGRLFGNVSALALLGYVSISAHAMASSDDVERPTVWVELGTQLERVDTAQTIFAPDFFDLASDNDRNAMSIGQRPSRYGVGGEANILFEPAGSDWIYSAAVRYGRSNSARHSHHETGGLPIEYNTYLGNPIGSPYAPRVRQFGDAQSTTKKSHLILDFLAGRDVGLGLFGPHGNSTINAGVRFAQFVSKADVTLHARPINTAIEKYYPGLAHFYIQNLRAYTAVLRAEHSTHAIGPSITWDASADLGGSDNDARVSLDWGINAAVLFGRQRSNIHHETTGLHRTGFPRAYNVVSSYSYDGPDRSRSRTVTIPNLGGFVGVSVRFPSAKVSLGYRGDFFFNATDNGIDAHKSADQKFYGPFAKISIGLGG
ncbi:MAG TPA: hypothetical protein VHE09_02010 [Rhizomicrobium sp.]|nr:hypothetical protein [Rhizomicrobium sp.]